MFPFRERGQRGARRVRGRDSACACQAMVYLMAEAEVQRPCLRLEAEPLRHTVRLSSSRVCMAKANYSLFLRNSFQKRTFLMPTSSWWQEYYMAPPLWSWVPCLISWAQLPAHTRFSLPPLTRGLCSARLAITYLWMPQSQLGGGTPGVPSWLLPGTAQP